MGTSVVDERYFRAVKICMPDMDGMTLAKELLDAHPDTNIIIQTANPQYALQANEWRFVGKTGIPGRIYDAVQLG